MLHNLQALIEHEEQTTEEGLENDMVFNSGACRRGDDKYI